MRTEIENLYLTFSKYTTEGIYHCDCGCIDEEHVKKLNSKTLRELKEEDLVSYHGSALYTWGDIEHYKHYLPRICELRTQNRNYSFVDLSDIYTKLEYGKWNEWDENEIRVIKDYVLADWIDLTNDNQSDIRDRQLEEYGNFFDIHTLTKLWDICKSENTLKKFVYFFYYHGSQILNGGLKINDKIYEQEMIPVIYSEQIIDKLEKEFFKNENNDYDFSEKISIVIQMIEQEQKIKNVR